MKLNLTVDLLVAFATVLLSVLVFVDHCSARLRPMASSAASLSKVGNLAADHLSALQQTSRKVTKSSVVGINWKNVLLLAGLKAGLVGAGLIKKKVAYKKLKGLKSIEGFDHLNYLNGLGGYAFGGYDPSWNGGQFDGKFAVAGSKFVPQQTPPPPYFFEPAPADSAGADWPTKQQLPTPRLHTPDTRYSIESHYAPVVWRKSSLCTDLHHCADYLTSSSITYQLLGPSLPLPHLPALLLPASSTLMSTKISSSPPHHQPQSDQPFVLTWVKPPSLVAAADAIGEASNELSHSPSGGHSLGSSISNVIGSLRSTLSSSISSNPKITNNLNNLNNPPKQIEQEKEDDKYPHQQAEQHGEQHTENQVDTQRPTHPNHSTQYTPASLQHPDNLANNLPFKGQSETPSEQLVENSNKISPGWSA